MVAKKGNRISAFIEGLILTSPKSQTQIASEIGYENANNLSNIKTGRLPMPLEKVSLLAEALSTDETRFMMLVLEERYPVIHQFIKKNLPGLSDEERQIINALRDKTKASGTLSDEKLKKILAAIEN
ncbi:MULTISPECIES: hypothetical protein [Enterobacterales]|jgi:hypothetical protein|uniref:XRE family transcriptional regulator n=1 Tax=Kluyvera ascorbata TaxID=51288 RepID=A0AB35XLA1_9ENTR|nr:MULTISPECIES: hypothetical protein [Enterobacterales]HCD6061277.1 XRE family transcriptional regulator [Enterobacter asburiae]HDS9658294.1 XRE family transcriptional regulator [Klebsiella pneumoniae subsp. pneumoniae]EKV8997249.1 XRE family transcriptional regulator [Enterobacter hormaechei]KPR17921.1 hypothetical protein AN666_15000 [Enterobacter hormaechei]MBW7732886.1 XRE family transcriptional regulator [Enterobacter hormaechei]